MITDITTGNTTNIHQRMPYAVHAMYSTRHVPESSPPELVHVTRAEGMEGARDLAMRMEQAGEGKVLNQFANPDNPRAHFEGTGPEIWKQTSGEIDAFVMAAGMT